MGVQHRLEGEERELVGGSGIADAPPPRCCSSSAPGVGAEAQQRGE
jgi:hypothetical protein